MLLEGKHILFFSAHAFGYEYEITMALQKEGAVVDYFDERPGNGFWVKALVRINRNFIGWYTNNYHSRILEETKKNKYDYIFFIKGESISASNVGRLRELHPEAQLVIYHWDSISNNKNALNLLPLFDKAFSFDRTDCEKIDRLSFLPLFYIEDYVGISHEQDEFKYDLLFVGTAHSDRYELIKKIEHQFEDEGRKCYSYFFFSSKALFYKMKIQNPVFKHLSSKLFHFVSLPKNELLKLFVQSKIIVDVQHPKQTGLTMRTIETLGARKKMITTNQMIKEYDFYNTNNILVVDRVNPVVPKDFMYSPYQDIPENIYSKYSIQNWIKVIFG